MANEGLQLDKVTFPGSYQFKKGAPANYIYRLDYRSLKAKDRESYLQLFADSGWELVGEMAGWMSFWSGFSKCPTCGNSARMVRSQGQPR